MLYLVEFFWLWFILLLGNYYFKYSGNGRKARGPTYFVFLEFPVNSRNNSLAHSLALPEEGICNPYLDVVIIFGLSYPEMF